MCQRISSACIFGVAQIIVNRIFSFIVNDVFNYCARPNCVPYFRFFFLLQSRAFGVAAAFKIKYSVSCPAVLVVTYQTPTRCCRQRSLAGSGKAEEYSGCSIVSDIGGTVHRKNSLFGKQSIHD